MYSYSQPYLLVQVRVQFPHFIVFMRTIKSLFVLVFARTFGNACSVSREALGPRMAPVNNFQPLAITNTFPMTPSSMSDTSSVLVTTESEVFMKFAGINSSKAPGPDQIAGWLLKENAYFLARPYPQS